MEVIPLYNHLVYRVLDEPDKVLVPFQVLEPFMSSMNPKPETLDPNPRPATIKTLGFSNLGFRGSGPLSTLNPDT